MFPDDSTCQELHLNTATCNLISYQILGIAKKPKHEYHSFMYNSVSSNSSPRLPQDTRETLHFPQKVL